MAKKKEKPKDDGRWVVVHAFRDARNGRFVTAEFAAKRPASTVKEKMKVSAALRVNDTRPPPKAKSKA